MKRTLILIFLLITGIATYAQDRNILARIAYEDAETAFAANKIDLAWSELNKVDSLLGKITPKSQYLRIQLWRQYATINPSNLEGAIQACKIYLDLAETNNLPEEKVLDITRLMVQLQRERDAYVAQKKAEFDKAEAEQKKRLAEDERKLKAYPAIVNYMRNSFKVYPGMPIDSLQMAWPATANFMKKATSQALIEGSQLYLKNSWFMSGANVFATNISYDEGIVTLNIVKERLKGIRLSLLQTKDRGKAEEFYLILVREACNAIFNGCSNTFAVKWRWPESDKINQASYYFDSLEKIEEQPPYAPLAYPFVCRVLLIKYEKKYSVEIMFE